MLKIKEFDDVIRHIEGKAYNSAIILLRAMKHDAESAEALKPSHNKQMVPCPECGRWYQEEYVGRSENKCPCGCWF